jgi:SPP1 gp7 family putative phage head morphogenesis protein
MNRKMSQGIMPSLAMGDASRDVRSAFSRAADDLEGLFSDTGYASSNQSAMSTYMDNISQIRYFEYTAINDSRTCKYCRSTHGVLYKPDESRPQLPRHPNCRCTYRPWFKSISGTAAEEFDKEVEKPPVPLGKSFDVSPDDFAGFGDGLNKLMRPINPDGTISDEDWIMWFNKQPADIREMMVGDAHDLANSIGVFGVDTPANKKAFIANMTKNIAKTFAEDMAKNSVRSFVFNTFTNKDIYMSLFDIYNNPKNVLSIISKLKLKNVMFDRGGVVQTSLADAFNRSVNELMPPDPDGVSPLQFLVSKFSGTKVFNILNKGWKIVGDAVMAKWMGVSPEEFAAFKPILDGDKSGNTLRDSLTKAMGLSDRKAIEHGGFLRSEFMQIIDPWFNISIEGIAPIADASIISRTKIFEQVAKDMAELPEVEALSANMRMILRKSGYTGGGIFNTSSITDEGLYAAKSFMNESIVDPGSDIIVRKAIRDIYGILMGKSQSSTKELLNSVAFKERLLEIPKAQREYLLSSITNAVTRDMIRKFFIDTTGDAVTILESVRISSVTPEGINMGKGAGAVLTRGVTSVTIGPDGIMYRISREELIEVWKRADPRVDTSKFVSAKISMGGKTVETAKATLKRIDSRGLAYGSEISFSQTPWGQQQKIIKAEAIKPDKSIYEYDIELFDKQDAVKNRELVTRALRQVRGIGEKFSVDKEVKVLAETGTLTIRSINPSVFGAHYEEVMNRIDITIGQVIEEMGIRPPIDNLSMDTVNSIASTVRNRSMSFIYADIHDSIMKYLGEVGNGEMFISRIKLLLSNKLGR